MVQELADKGTSLQLMPNSSNDIRLGNTARKTNNLANAKIKIERNI